MVEIPETLLFGAAIGIFIPLFIFLIKMVMEQANTKNKLSAIDAHITDTKEWLKRLTDLETDLKILRITLKNIENNIMDLFGKKNRNTSSRLDDSGSSNGGR